MTAVKMSHLEINLTAFRGKVVKQRDVLNTDAPEAEWLILEVTDEEREQLRSCFDDEEEEE